MTTKADQELSEKARRMLAAHDREVLVWRSVRG